MPPSRKTWVENKKGLGPFYSLSGLIGYDKAKAFLELAHDELQSRNVLDQNWDNELTQWMQRELETVQSTQHHVSSLLARARANTLRGDLRNHLMPDAEYFSDAHLQDLTLPEGKKWTAIEEPAPEGKALARKRAVFWICSPSVGEQKLPELQKVRAILKEYVPDTDTDGKTGPALGRTSDFVRKIHKAAFPECGRHRFNYMLGPTNYPSTVGASYLLDQIFQLTSNIQWPPHRDQRWLDAAVFFLGALGAVQAFKDGNKRLSRIAYAIVLIKGGFVFKGPTAAYMASLYNM